MTSVKVKQGAEVTGVLHQGLVQLGQNTILSYQMAFAGDLKRGLSQGGSDNQLGIYFVFMSSSCRMVCSDVMQSIKSTMIEKGLPLSSRSAHGLGLRDTIFFIRLDSVQGPIIALILRNMHSAE